ncbi:glutathione S-transferase family protein [Aspergillus melleus]|uniref:glutathione S-transferase family protein n=1 Tax=Aspergillus melleus TaxID=138277 RepID=UPI001E8DA014|nr:glutathione S- transferase, nitrogen catabolite repression regulator [Aspergillus melleus]KAH8429150.1 glutathione S- transferase, nitrogen catabolite repression regulator [Aspergillus melleus]
MSLQPIKLYWRNQVPNPSKVLVILEELGLPYKTEFVELEGLRQKPFTDINPNGKVPAIYDPNQDVTLWESGAIVQYLVETYDRDHKISYGTAPERLHLLQWSFFQASGQGPYFGQSAWFNLFHEKFYGDDLESPKIRYGNEVKRIAGMLDGVLAHRDWLVGDKCTYADLAFVMWNLQVPFFMAGRTGEHAWNPAEFPHFSRWQDAMMARDSVKRTVAVLQDKEVESL